MMIQMRKQWRFYINRAENGIQIKYLTRVETKIGHRGSEIAMIRGANPISS